MGGFFFTKLFGQGGRISMQKNFFTFRSKINGLDFMDAGEHKMTRSIGYFASKETGMFIHTGV
jgi:hypothetical protein